MTAAAALATWALNVALGLRLLLRWRARQRGLPPVAFVHLATAASGLALWITYLAVGEPRCWRGWRSGGSTSTTAWVT